MDDAPKQGASEAMPEFITVKLVTGAEITIGVSHIVQIVASGPRSCVIVTTTDQLSVAAPREVIAKALKAVAAG